MKIGIGINNFSYTPEAYAYADYLTKKGWSVQLDNEDRLEKSLDIHLYFMGLKPFWKKNKNKCHFEIHEYQSLSTPPYAHLKNLIKNFVNCKPDGRIFLNKTVKNYFHFKDNIPSLYRDMGVDKSLFLNPPKNPAYDLIYAGSISGRPGLIEELIRLAKINLKILVVGNINQQVLDTFKTYKNVKFTGKVKRSELPELYQQAKAGLNFTPDLFPFNIQTSTKTLEYCAAGLGVVSNNYKWVQDFQKERNAKFLYLEDLISIDNLNNFQFTIPNVNDLEWLTLLDKIQFENFLKLIIS